MAWLRVDFTALGQSIVWMVVRSTSVCWPCGIYIVPDLPLL